VVLRKLIISIFLSNSFTIPRFHVLQTEVFKGNCEIWTFVKKKHVTA